MPLRKLLAFDKIFFSNHFVLIIQRLCIKHLLWFWIVLQLLDDLAVLQPVF